MTTRTFPRPRTLPVSVDSDAGRICMRLEQLEQLYADAELALITTLLSDLLTVFVELRLAAFRSPLPVDS